MNKLGYKIQFKTKRCHKIEISVIKTGSVGEIGEFLVVFGKLPMSQLISHTLASC